MAASTTRPITDRVPSVPAPSVLAVAYSGGRDSTALLHAVAKLAALGEFGDGATVLALHVHHGLSPHADAWWAHTQAQCLRWAQDGLPVRWQGARLKGKPRRGESVEAWARQGRYRALAEMAKKGAAAVVLLAHHRQDQAETFLLQALRGAGVAGLSAMPMATERDGIGWLRPWLHRTRCEIQSYIDHHGLSHIEDDSNADTRFARNRLRLEVLPALAQAFPGAEAQLAQCSAHLADAQACLTSWLDGLWPALTDTSGRLSLQAWQALAPPAQRLVLLAWVSRACAQRLTQAGVERLQRDWMSAHRSGARWPLADGELRLYRGCLSWSPSVPELTEQAAGPSTLPQSWPCTIGRAGRHALPHGQGKLQVRRVQEGGVPLACLAQAVWRCRVGGEQFQSGPGRPPRSLKKQFQQAGVSAWARQGPLLWLGEQLLFVPGLGLDARVALLPGSPRVELTSVE